MSMQTQHLYEFGPFRLDKEEGLLLRDGKPVALTPKALETLSVLVENSGQVLEKEELINTIWPDTFVEEANLAVNISILRRALGERPAGGQYIETIPKRGYRFAEAVREVWGERVDFILREEGAPPVAVERDKGAHFEAGAERGATNIDSAPGAAKAVSSPWMAADLAGSRMRRKRAVAVAVAAAIIALGATLYFAYIKGPGPARPPRLAILPFVNLKPDAQTDFLGFSLADAITTRLSYVRSLVVCPSSYMEKYRNQQRDPKAVAEELKADTLLTATFLKEGETLRIMPQLIDVRRDEILWKRSLEFKVETLFALQDRVSQQIIEELRVKLSAAEGERFRRDVPDNSLAYDLFLRGVDLYQQNEFRAAVEMLEKSVELAPNYARAWAHLGRAYNANASFGFGGREHHIEAEAAYEQALKLDPEQIEAHIFMANLFTDTNRAERAVALLREVLKTNPNLAEAHWELGYAYRFAGMLNESVEECERARQLDPQVKLYSSAFNSYLYTGQYDRFLGSLPAGEEKGFILFYRGFGNYHLGNRERAKADFDRAYEVSPDLYTQIGKALGYTIGGQNVKALELLRDTEKGIEGHGVGDAEGIYKVAQGYAVAGDKASALRVLGRSIEQGFFCYPYFISDPLLENIRSEALYAPLMEKARGRHEEFRRKFF